MTAWARPETVRCDRCRSYFHMHCVSPPLAAKPTRGYGWTCAPCSRAYEEALNKNNNNKLKGAGVNGGAVGGTSGHRSSISTQRGVGVKESSTAAAASAAAAVTTTTTQDDTMHDDSNANGSDAPVDRPSTPSANGKPRSNAPPARARGRPRKDQRQAEKEETMPVRHFNMWPFRYFGCATW
jgi:hypothetical protein